MVMRSAGLVLYRERDGRTEVLIGHMGGPLWANKDERAWSFPKGQYGDDETPRAAARREFEEELGIAPPDGGGGRPGGWRVPPPPGGAPPRPPPGGKPRGPRFPSAPRRA
ncbi:NUDIX domain-containing protein, partial [Streptomyces sp. NPDC058953]|uniref:NUDIX domain-containing protein n=1 Tax=Streptomyces sp. NPDC058953 TaxID=3346676 RepID=UPI003683A7C7